MIKPGRIKNLFNSVGLFPFRAVGARISIPPGRRRRPQVSGRRLSAEMTLVDEVAKIVTSTLDVEQVYQQFFEALRKLVEYDRGGITLIDPGSETYSVRHMRLDVPSRRRIGDPVPLRGSYTGEVLSSGRSMLRRSISPDSTSPHDQGCIQLGIRSILAVPLVSEGLIFGTIVVASRKEGTYSSREQVFLERLATQIAPAVANAQLYEQIVNTRQALQQSEERFRTFVEQAADPIFVINRNGLFVDVNDMACSALGYSREELLTMSVPDISLGITPQRQAQTWNLLRGGGALTVENRHRRKDGATFPVEVRVSRIELGGQEYKLVLARDITRRKRGEEVQRRLTEENSVMAEIGRVISSSLDINEVYGSLGEEIRKLIPFDQLAMTLVDEKSGTTLPTWTLGTYVPGRQSGDKVPLEGSMSGEVVRTRTPVMLEVESEADIESRFPMLLPAYHAGLRSFLVVPLIDRDAAIGALQVRLKARSVYTQGHLRLLERIGDQIAGAVASSQLYAERSRLADENLVVAEISRILSASLELGDVFEKFATAAKKLISFDRVGIGTVDLNRNSFTSRYVTGGDLADPPSLDAIALQGTLTGEVVISGRSVIFHSEDRNEVVLKFPALLSAFDQGIRSFLSVPILRNDDVIGALNFWTFSPQAYGGQDLRIAENLSHQIAGAIGNAGLYAERKRLADESSAMAEIGRIIGSSLDISGVYEDVYQEMRKLVPFDRIVINLADLEQGTLTNAYVSGLDIGEKEDGHVFQIATSFAGRVIKKGCTQVGHISSETELERNFSSLRPQYQAGLRSFLAVPLVSTGATIGVMRLNSTTPNAYTEEVVEVVERIAAHIAPALENARLYNERKSAEEQVRESLREKEVLLQEINHRVKNNLQIISSLLNLQARSLQDDSVREILEESQSRIRAMALIHDKLYFSEDLSRVDFGDYLRVLTGQLQRSHGLELRGIELHIDSGPAYLGLDTAIPCGLIVNELVSNSMKHAFKADVSGEIRVSLRENLKEYSLIVTDNGVGFPKGFDLSKSDTLGLKLVNALVGQLGGAIELHRGGGSVIRIRFPSGRGA